MPSFIQWAGSVGPNPDGFSDTTPQIDANALGQMLVTWFGESGREARVLGPDHAPLGDVFQLPYHAAAMLEDGSVGVAYVTDALYFQRLDATGTAIGGAVRIADTADYYAVEPLSGGGAVIIFDSGTDVRARVLSPGYVLAPDSFDVGDLPFSSFATSSLPSGGFVAAWLEYVPSISAYRHHVQAWAADGTPIGPEFTGTGGPDVALDAFPDGRYVFGLEGRLTLFSAAGTALNPSPIVVLEQDPALITDFELAYLSNAFLVATYSIWPSSDIVYQVLTADGLKVGGPGSVVGESADLVAVDGDTFAIAYEYAYFNPGGPPGGDPGALYAVDIDFYDLLTGNIVIGSAAADTLSGLGGEKLLIGRAGDDRYVVDGLGDTIQEAAGQGFDRVSASADYGIVYGISVEHLTTTNNAGTAPINLVGNAFAQAIFGNAGSNGLVGNGGGDTLYGLGGDDRLYVVDSSDKVREDVGGGVDRVYVSGASYVLDAGQEIELLSSFQNSAVAAADLTGNAFAQYVYGNNGTNVLDGGGGGDVLVGLAGSDTYIVRDARDSVREAPGGANGTDRVRALADFTLAAGQAVELIDAFDPAATTPLRLAGNELVQHITGNAGNNVLIGGGGADLLRGLGGDDSYYVSSASTVISEGASAGTDRVLASVSFALSASNVVEILSTASNGGTQAINLTGNSFAQAVYGNAGANTLNGGGGRDTLIGMGGADSFLFDTALNRAFVASFGAVDAAGNVDLIHEFGADDRIVLKGSLFGLAPGALGGAFNTGATATQADDRVLFDTASRAVLFDADGVGGQAAQLIAFINNPFVLDAAHIAVI